MVSRGKFPHLIIFHVHNILTYKYVFKISALQEGVQATLYQGPHPGPCQATTVHLRLARVPIPPRRHPMLSSTVSSKLKIFILLFIYLFESTERNVERAF